MIQPATKNKIKKFLGKAIIYLLIGYTFFLVGKVIWTNWILKKQTEEIKSQISQLEQQNQTMGNLILYYKSDSFREVEARKELGLKKPDEVAIAVPVKKYENFSDELTAQQDSIKDKPKTEALPNWSAWWQYFTK